MEHKWRIPFTILTMSVILLPAFYGSWIISVFSYLFTGFLIWVTAAGAAKLNVIILWLPALWIKKVFDKTI